MIRERLLSIDRSRKKTIVLILDFILILSSILFAGLMTDLEFSNLNFINSIKFIWIPFFSVFIFAISGVYRSVIRYIDFSSIFLVLKCIFFIFFFNFGLSIIFDRFYFFNSVSLNNTGWVICFLCCITLIPSLRIFANYFFKDSFPGKKVLIYGAGNAGRQLAGALRESTEMEPVAFIDDNTSLHNTYIGGIKVISSKKISKIITRNNIEEVLVAMPSSSKTHLQ